MQGIIMAPRRTSDTKNDCKLLTCEGLLGTMTRRGCLLPTHLAQSLFFPVWGGAPHVSNILKPADQVHDSPILCQQSGDPSDLVTECPSCVRLINIPLTTDEKGSRVSFPSFEIQFILIATCNTNPAHNVQNIKETRITHHIYCWRGKYESRHSKPKI